MEEKEEIIEAKKVFVFLLEKELQKKKISKAQLARKIGTSRSAVNRLLNPEKTSTFESMCKAVHAVGKHLRIRIL